MSHVLTAPPPEAAADWTIPQGWERYTPAEHALWDKLYAQYNLKAFIAGNTGTQALGWYRTEIRTINDYKGKKLRMPGWGGAVLAKLGAQQVVLPGGEIFAALQSGAVDGVSDIRES